MLAKPASEPVRLREDAETGDRFLIYGTEKGTKVELRYEGEVSEGGNVQKVHVASSDRPTALYSLDMVISVGYRVSSKQATMFRVWATDKLVQFATKGFVVDVELS